MHRLLAGPFQRVIIVRTQLIMFGIIIDCSTTSNKWISKPNSPNVVAHQIQEEKPSKDDNGASMERICAPSRLLRVEREDAHVRGGPHHSLVHALVPHADLALSHP